MSSALDEDTRRTIDRGRETAGAMLRAAQKDLQKVFIVFLVGFLGSFYALQYVVWDFLKRVTRARMEESLGQQVEIIAQTPFDVILLQAKIGLTVGIIFAVPPFLYYSRDALRERGMWPSSPVAPWKLALVLALAAGLFVIGVAYGYLLFFPLMFAFLANNALSAGFAPTYSIVKWAQFIFLLTISFGIAAQMPLAITGLSYSGIVPYETFRDKWRHAVVGIFVFGALFSPPDPFTQIMWAVPLLFLYGASLYLAKVVVTMKRGSERIDVGAVARARWNLLAGVAVLGFAAIYVFYVRGGREYANAALAWAGSKYRFLPPGSTLPVAPDVAVAVYGAVAAAAVVALALLYFVYRELEQGAGPAGVGAADFGDPEEIDLATLDAAGVRAAPAEAFAGMSEDDAVERARSAMEDDDPERARAILDRFDEVETEREAADESADAPGGATPANVSAEATAKDVGDRASRAGETFMEELTDGERDEDDIGGYYSDVTFILDSVTSRAFRIVAVFGIVLVSVFAWLYSGGIGAVYAQFLSRLPAAVTPQEVLEESFNVVALHPVEALIFEVKFSTLVAAFASLPVAAYYAWPALRERGFVRGHRRVIFGWVAALAVGLVGGFALGYLYVAPLVISYLVADALAADMIIAYRITNFFWLIFFTTAGIGLLADVPVVMLLLNTAGVSYHTMRGRWREVTVGILAFAAVFTPAGIVTMFLVTVPLMVAYGVGLAVLFVVTLGGRRDLAPARATDL